MKIKELLEAKERSVLSVMGKQEPRFNGSFYCKGLNLTSLEGSPIYVSEDFDCCRNSITSLKGGPDIVTIDYLVSFNYSLGKSANPFEGGPSRIGGDMYCNENGLTSLKGIHKYIKHIGGVGYFDNNPLQSHVLGLMRIDGLQEVMLENEEVQQILNRHLYGNRDMFECQEELVDSGFPEFAKL